MSKCPWGPSPGCPHVKQGVHGRFEKPLVWTSGVLLMPVLHLGCRCPSSMPFQVLITCSHSTPIPIFTKFLSNHPHLEVISSFSESSKLQRSLSLWQSSVLVKPHLFSAVQALPSRMDSVWRRPLCLIPLGVSQHLSWGPSPGLYIVGADWWMNNGRHYTGILSQPSSSKKRTGLFPWDEWQGKADSWSVRDLSPWSKLGWCWV